MGYKKSRIPLKTELLQTLIQHIRSTAKEKGIFIIRLNGHQDHLHCLISLGKDQSIATTIQLLKGESSFWINKNHLTGTKFHWAHEYFAVSVSESSLPQVVAYIDNQQEHHRKVTWTEEYQKFLKVYGFEKFG